MIQSLFQECLLLIRSGTSLEDVLASHPREAEELRPLLMAALLAEQARQDTPPIAPAQSRSLGRFLSEAQRLRQAPIRKTGLSAVRRAYSVAILLVVIFIATGTAVAASAHALPGQIFYPVKLATENTRLILATGPRQRLDLEKGFDQERADEVEQLIQLSRDISVNFTGSVSKIDTREWVISGMRVLLPAKFNVPSDIRVGYQVVVSGQILPDGSISASEIHAKSYQFKGVLTEMSDGQWVVDGISVNISSQTTINGEPSVGSRVWVNGILLSDGSIQSLQLVATGLPPRSSEAVINTPQLDQLTSTTTEKSSTG